MHSERLLDHFENPRNVGKLDPPAVRVEVSNPVCGDMLVLSALVSADGRLERTAYQVRGCTAAIAAGSALTVLLQDRTLAEAATLVRSDIEAELGGLRNESKHAAALAIDALTALVEAAKRPK